MIPGTSPVLYRRPRHCGTTRLRPEGAENGEEHQRGRYLRVFGPALDVDASEILALRQGSSVSSSRSRSARSVSDRELTEGHFPTAIDIALAIRISPFVRGGHRDADAEARGRYGSIFGAKRRDAKPAGTVDKVLCGSYLRLRREQRGSAGPTCSSERPLTAARAETFVADKPALRHGRHGASLPGFS